MQVFSESIISEMKPVASESAPNVLCVVAGPCFGPFGKVNRNNRIYSRKLVEDKILKNQAVQEAIKNKAMLGEGGHPANRVDISYPEVALSVEKLWIPDNDSDMLWGRFAILDTPVGRILETLVKYGTKLGISARAMAESVQKDGHEVILENSYELITFDAVPEPGFKCARLEKVESVSKPIDKMSTNELKESAAALKSFKNPVFESRIRMLNSEICKRENKANIYSIIESADKLSKALDNNLHSISNIKYEKQLSSLIKEAKDLIKTLNKKQNTASTCEKTNTKNNSISNYSNNRINKFNTEHSITENFNTDNLFNNNEDTSVLERMCLNFRRNIHE